MIFSLLIFWGFTWIYLDMNLFYLTMLNSWWFFNLKILIFDSEKKALAFIFSNILLADSVLFLLLELLIRWVLEPFKLLYTSPNCAFIFFIPYLGELLRGSFNFYWLFLWHIQSRGYVTYTKFYFNEYVLHSQYFQLVFFISACFYLSCFLNSYSTFMAVMPSFTSSGSQIYLFYILFCIALLFAFCLQYSQPEYWYLGYLS